MKSRTISETVIEPYAEALLALGQEHNDVEAFGNGARLLLDVLEAASDLQHFLAVPLVSDEAKKRALQRAFGDALPPLMQSFLMLLVDRRRIAFLGAICQRYLALQRNLEGVVLVEAISAVALSESQQKRVKERVQALTGARQVELSLQIDPGIIGGVIIKVGSQIMDASLRGQLRRLTNRLAAASA